ncbi:hypothetical protein Mx4_p73 [Myxococcus phage Mx4]|nr:hypothetical protein Mx4_p73 [Myxococcus phage Mx4]
MASTKRAGFSSASTRRGASGGGVGVGGAAGLTLRGVRGVRYGCHLPGQGFRGWRGTRPQTEAPSRGDRRRPTAGPSPSLQCNHDTSVPASPSSNDRRCWRELAQPASTADVCCNYTRPRARNVHRLSVHRLRRGESSGIALGIGATNALP